MPITSKKNIQQITNFFDDFEKKELIDFLSKIIYVERIIDQIQDNTRIKKISIPSESTKGDLIWISESNDSVTDLINDCKANFIICSNKIDLSNLILEDKLIIISSKPRVSFAFLMTHVVNKNRPKSQIHDTAILDINCQIGKNVTIGANSQIGNCFIGNNVTISSNVVLHDNCFIGDNVIIKSGTVIGTDGYGFVQNEKGNYYKFPHFGSVIIEDNVEVGSNVSIDCGTIGNTVIGQGSKIDNLVHIGHNVIIGKNVLIAATTVIAGSAIIGDDSQIWVGCKIANNITIGKYVNVGIGSVVITDIGDNKKCFGNPARVISSSN